MSIPSNKSPDAPNYTEVTPNIHSLNASNPLIGELGKQILGTPLSLEDLPHKMLARICRYLPRNIGLPFVSKTIHANFHAALNHQINQGHINFYHVGCNTVKKAVQRMMDYDMVNADFSPFLDPDGQDLKNLRTSCPHIISLNLLVGTFTENQLAEALGAFSHLQTLNLRSLKFPLSDQFTNALGTLTHLRALSLWNCLPLPASFAEMLGTLTHLENLALNDQSLSTQISEAFKKLTQLKTLELQSCQLDGNIFVEDEKVLPQLKSLNLLNSEISGDQLITFTKSHPGLTELNLFSCYQVPGDQIIEALGHLPNLRNLNIGFCLQISGDQLITIAKGCPYLTHLSLPALKISLDHIKECLSNLLHLELLYLGYCYKISESEKEDLKNQFPRAEFQIY